jgi:hypothetical protein
MAVALEKPRWRRWLRRLVVAGVVTTTLIAVVGFLVAPPIARRVAERQLSELLGRKVTIGRIRLNPFALSVEVDAFQIAEADQVTPFVGFGRLYVNAQLSSVFRRAPIVAEVSLDSLRLHVVRTKATAEAFADVGAAYNFSDIVARLAARPKSPEPPEPPGDAPPRFSVNNIRITDGAVTFDDLPTGGHHEVTAIALGVPFVSTLPVYLDSFVEPGLRLRVDGTPFAMVARSKPFEQSLETVVELRIDALDLTRFVPFVPMRLPFTLDSARLTLALDFAFARPQVDAPSLKIKGRVALDKLDLRDKHPGGAAPVTRVALDHLEIDIKEADLSEQRFHLEKILIAGLDVHARRLRDGSLSLAHLVPEPPATGGSQGKPEQSGSEAPVERKSRQREKLPGPTFTIDDLALTKTAFHLRDESVSPPFVEEVRDVRLSVRGLSNTRGATARIEAGLRAEPGGTLTDRGTLRLVPLEARGTIALNGFEPAQLAPYYRDLIAFDVTSGSVDVSAGYEVTQDKTRTSVRVQDGSFALRDLALRRRAAGQDFFRLAELAVRGAKLDLDAHSVEVASFATRAGHLRAARDEKGVVDLTTLVPPPPASAAPASAADIPPSAPTARVAPSASASAPAAPTWTVRLARVDVDGWGVRFEDHAVTPQAVLSVDPVSVHLTDVSTARGARFGVDLRLGLNKTGRLQVTGTTALDPFAATVRFKLGALEILPLQPYFRDQLNMTVTDGTVSLQGQAAIKTAAGHDPDLDATVDLDVANLATADGDKQEPLLQWKSLHVGGLHLRSPATEVSIHDVALTDFDCRLILFPDAHFNLQDVLATQTPAKATKTPTTAPAKASTKTLVTTPAPGSSPGAPSSAPSSKIAIGQVTLQGGHITYNDRLIRPAYTVELTELGGRVSGLSSDPSSTATVDIRGSVDHSGSLVIAGTTNPLAKDLAVDLQVNLKDFELPPTSPYVGKYAGYGVGKGKLNLSLDYKIAHGALAAKNKLVLDQFTFGDKVNSPDAVKLPVRLAVALLKDRHGVIDIDLPIGGSLADPQFKIWPEVWKVLGHLVVKAVTAPFSLIASAFGGGDELSRIDFPPGAATLDATADKRLGTLGRVLRERPGLSFEIEGAANEKRDRDGLRQLLYERKLKAQKLSQLVQADQAVTAVDQLQIDPAERSPLIEKAYKAETFPKPRNALGFEKSLPPPEMEKLILANLRVEDDDLRALALQRATAVQTTLSKQASVGADRLFLVPARLDTTGGHVELKLKKD